MFIIVLGSGIKSCVLICYKNHRKQLIMLIPLLVIHRLLEWGYISTGRRCYWCILLEEIKVCVCDAFYMLICLTILSYLYVCVWSMYYIYIYIFIYIHIYIGAVMEIFQNEETQKLLCNSKAAEDVSTIHWVYIVFI